MSAHADFPRIFATLLALLGVYLVWCGSDLVVDLLQWPDLLPLERIGGIVLGLSCLDFLADRLHRFYSVVRGPQAK